LRSCVSGLAGKDRARLRRGELLASSK
jgi:hypothetical protein